MLVLHGVMPNPRQDEGHYAIAVGGGPVRVLGLWWLEAAQRGAVQVPCRHKIGG
jgi:hypothetical protein